MKFTAFCFIVLSLLGCKSDTKQPSKPIIVQTPWAFPYFEKLDSINPILSPSSDLQFTDPITGRMHRWEERNVLNPTAIVRNDSVYLLYRAQDSMGTSRIGMAVSTDGIHFTKQPQPVFYPDQDAMKVFEWNYKKDNKEQTNSEDCYFCYFDGVEDPRIIQDEKGVYFMTYTSYDGKTARLSIASSKDLRHWEKHGLVLSEEKYRDTWSKAGAIVGERIGNKVIAKKINDLYWMYFGDTSLFMATSKDLKHWKIAENDESKEQISVMHPRMGYFDSRLVESGPYALYTEKGILLIYNGSNAANYNDSNLPKFTYAAGQALFNKNKPYQLIDRAENYFIHPDKDYEKVGEVNEVCFVEGLVYFRNQWLLYYGTADSKIAVAVYNP
jgi:beta-1,2-mannosidase